MSLVGFHCPGDRWAWQTIKDCRECDHQCLPIEILEWIWYETFVLGKDHYHSDPRSISATETMGCLRRGYYNRTSDYTEEPQSFLARLRGTVIHRALEEANQDGCSEVHLCCPLGDGYTLDGTADILTNGYVGDYKTMNSPRKTYDEDNARQLSIYDDLRGDEFTGERKLRVIQIGGSKLAVHETHRIEGAGDEAKRRAGVLVGALAASDPSPLPPEGRFNKVKFTGKTECHWCPHCDECEAEDPIGGDND